MSYEQMGVELRRKFEKLKGRNPLRRATVVFSVDKWVSNDVDFTNWLIERFKAWAKVGLIPEYDVILIEENMKVIWER